MDYCESCLATGVKTPATTRSVNPEFSGYELCEECAAEYDSRLQEDYEGHQDGLASQADRPTNLTEIGF